MVTLSLSDESLTSTCCCLCCFHRAQGEECPPPPPVSWGHVTGLQPLLLGHLKGVVKGLDNPVQRDGVLTLIPAYLVYLQAHYQQLSRQVRLPGTCVNVCAIWKFGFLIIYLNIFIFHGMKY